MLAWMVVSTALAQTMNVSSAELLVVEEVLIGVEDVAGFGVEQALQAPEGGAFGVAVVTFQMQWPEGTEEWSAGRDEITLAVGDERIQPVGVLGSGRFNGGGRSQSLRSRNSDTTYTWEYVYPLASVPQEASFIAGDQTVPLTIQPKTTRLAPLAERMSVDIVGTEVVSDMTGEFRQGDFQGTVAYRHTVGRLVAVDVKVTANAANTSQGGFFWGTADMSLSWDGGTTPPVGQWGFNKLSNMVSHNLGVGDTQRNASRLLFVVPDGVSTATLRYQGTEVATVTIGG